MAGLCVSVWPDGTVLTRFTGIWVLEGIDHTGRKVSWWYELNEMEHITI